MLSEPANKPRVSCFMSPNRIFVDLCRDLMPSVYPFSVEALDFATHVHRFTAQLQWKLSLKQCLPSDKEIDGIVFVMKGFIDYNLSCTGGFIYYNLYMLQYIM